MSLVHAISASLGYSSAPILARDLANRILTTGKVASRRGVGFPIGSEMYAFSRCEFWTFR